MEATPPSKRKRRLRITEWVLLGVVVAAMVGVHLMFYFWPFRYRQVHPTLESTFRSRVDVKRYHRTYFPHPGFVAEGVTFHRRGDMSIPPLATIDRMTVLGTWTGLILHPHTLFQMRLDGLHVQIPPPGTKAHGQDFGGGVLSSSQMKMHIETLTADATTLDFLRPNGPPLRFAFSTLQLHNVQAGQPFGFFLRVSIPRLSGIVEANGSLGPFQTGKYNQTQLSGTYSLLRADLKRVSSIFGHVAADGHFSGTLSAVDVQGKASIPDFRVSDAHAARVDATYHATVDGTKGDVQIHNALFRTGDCVLTARGSVAGSPKTANISFATTRSRLEQLLAVIESGQPSVVGFTNFQAVARFQDGKDPFLKRLDLQGQISIDDVRFIKDKSQHEMDSFSRRVRKDSPGSEAIDPHGDLEVTADASSHTKFHDGMADFPDIHVRFPGAQAQLHGTFDLLNTKIHLKGKAELQRDVSKAATGWKSVLLKPLAPFFRHGKAGAVLPIVVTGTPGNPNIQQDVLHNK